MLVPTYTRDSSNILRCTLLIGNTQNINIIQLIK